MQELKQSLWSQFGASIKMLENAIQLCSDELLKDNQRLYFIIFHSLIFLDYYATIPPKDFIPYLDFSVLPEAELPIEAIDDLIPNRYYTKTELLEYLKLSTVKCKKLVESIHNGEKRRFIEEMDADAMDFSSFEIVLYNMRHTQHHAAQLNLILRKEIDQASKWVFRTEL